MGYWTVERIEKWFPAGAEGRFLRTRVGTTYVDRDASPYTACPFRVGLIIGLSAAQAALVLDMIGAFPPDQAPVAPDASVMPLGSV